MQPAAMCFSVMVRPDDSQAGHSVTQLAVEVEDCLGPRNTHLKHGKRECHINQTSQNTLNASEIDVSRSPQGFL